MTSLTGHFQSFLFIFFVPPTLDLKKNPVNQLIKKILALSIYGKTRQQWRTS